MKKIIISATCGLILASCTANTEYPKFTECLNTKQVVMFGASWCPHCAEQKQMFGRSVKNLPYFECSKNGEQVKECDDRAITSYPTWQFPEESLSKLPKEAITNLLNNELDKVRATSKSLKHEHKDKPENIKIIADFESKTEKLIASDVSEFEKLKKLTVLSEGPQGLEEVNTYKAGRIAGQRPLADIALYAGCSTEYQTDLQTVK